MSTISGSVTSGITLALSGAYASPLTITNTGYVSGAGSSSAIYGPNTDAWTVANLGRVTAPGTHIGIDLSNGGSVNNSGTVVAGNEGVYITGSSGTVTNSGSITSTNNFYGVDLYAGGLISNTGYILGGVRITNQLGTLTNSGRIIDTSGVGAAIEAGGSVDNSATISAAGGFFGIYLGGAGQIINRVSGYIHDGVDVKRAPGTVVNYGRIVNPTKHGVALYAGGLVTNTGIISADQIGVLMPAGGTLVNSGTINSYGLGIGVEIAPGGTLTNSGVISASGLSFGVYIGGDQGGTVIDSGTISGDKGSVYFFNGSGSYASNLLILQPGYKLNGLVQGGLTATNTIELAGSVGAGLTVNYNGLSLTNFTDVLFGSSGYDTLKVNNTSGTVPVTISGFTLTSDVIDLTAIGTNGTVTQFDTVGHILTISGSGGTVTFKTDSSDAAAYTTASDGAGGTLLEVAPAEPQSTLPVGVGGTATISHAFLSSDDPGYGPDQRIYTVEIAPQHGTLLLDGAATSNFTQADIDNGLVQYVENGDAASSDFFAFRLADPAGNNIGEEPFQMAILDQPGLVEERNAALTVAPGGGAPIFTNWLDTVALGNAPDQIVYTLLSAPAHGAVIVNQAPVTSFTQAEIDDHQVLFVSNGDAVVSDSFAFQVSDQAGDRSAVQTFTIDLSGGAGPPPAMTFSDLTLPASTASPATAVSGASSGSGMTSASGGTALALATAQLPDAAAFALPRTPP